MPLIIEGRVPTRWAQKSDSRAVVSIDRYVKRAKCIHLGLINNMPDAALEDTELQFFELLDIASGDVPIFLKLYSLTGVPRADRGQRHLNEFYFGLDELWNSQLDGVIVTGTEPRQPDLRQESYWSALTDVLDWAERNTVSTVLSCLAAHAGVLHSDGIQRHLLSDKQFGVFESTTLSDHELTRHATSLLRFPHSRWNELRENELIACGYEVLTKSDQAGVDVFVKQKKKSLFVHFQGHPEYQAETLFKEYRRDIKRFLRGERENYPTMPHGYFDQGAARILTDFQRMAVADRREEHLALFPETVAKSLQKTWQSAATCIYRNWLQYVLAKTAEASRFVPVTDSCGAAEPRRSAVL
ncbi:MAG: homoserine O-succinyltransferase [Candidatus Sulfotelmatobacter sp.]